MAAKTLPLEELINTTISDLFAYSGSKLLDQTEWANQQKEEICKFPSDTLHKQGYLVHSMVEVFSKSEKKEKSKALCNLASRLWFAHEKLYGENLTMKQDFSDLNTKLVESEEEVLSLLAEKLELSEKVYRLQNERVNDDFEPNGSGAREHESDRDEKARQLFRDLESARDEIEICHERINNLHQVNERQVDSLRELQNQAHENRRRSDAYQQKIQELEKSLKEGTPRNPSDCDGSCKSKIRQMENLMREADEEMETLKNRINEESDRYWDARNSVYEREINIEKKENQIVSLKNDKETLIEQVKESRKEVEELQAHIIEEGKRQINSSRPLAPKVVKTWGGSDLAELSDNEDSRPRKKTHKTSQREGYGETQNKRAFFQPYPLDDEGSDPERAVVPKYINKTKKNERPQQDRKGDETPPPANAKSIKTVRGMLPSFSKNNKTGSILEHLTLYQRLMEALEMSSDAELRMYLSWTFAPDSQSFFLSVDSQDYESWAEFRCEVIRHFSPHRNSHEALRHALNLRCESNQHPRDYLQMLKNAFAQVQKEVNVETKQFKDAYFYGLPKLIRTQIARDYGENRSIDWIYKQAKSIYDVSRIEETTEGKDKPKPSKVCELSKEKELPFEAGGNKPRPPQKEKERKKSPERKVSEKLAKDPEVQKTISPRYKGNNPIPNFVHRNKEEQSDARESTDREKPRESERSEREPYRPQGRDGNAPNNYWRGGYDRPDQQSYRRVDYDYREREDTRPHSDHRDRYQQWDERPCSPRQSNRFNALEEQIHDLTQHCRKMLSKDAGPSPRVHTVSSNEPTDREAKQPGQ